MLIAFLLPAQTSRDLKVERSETTFPDKRTRWALIIGISSYKYAPPAAQLRFAHRDAEEFATLLRSPLGGGFESRHLQLLTESTATLAAVRAALHNWLTRSVGPNDIVYLFFAGHAVVAERQQTYFVAHDSDPQNLHATALPFDEVNDVLTRKLRAALVVLFADACHAGGIGWTADPKSLSRAHGPIDALGSRDRAILKLLASRPSERSYEDERWGGGHGVFSFSVLNALRGAAEREKDGVVRAGEVIEYLSRVVPEQTSGQQTPRVAGNFEGGLPLSVVHTAAPLAGPAPASLKVSGKPGAAVYVDNRFRGSIRPDGQIVIDQLSVGSHLLSIDVPAHDPFEQRITLGKGETVFDLARSPEFLVAQLRTLVRNGAVLGKNGAYEFYKGHSFDAQQQSTADSLIASALEQTGQECVSDYVQSTTNALKRPMFMAAAEALTLLQNVRPGDQSLQAKALFCRARADIAGGDFSAALASLQKSIAIDSDFACSHNALGVALLRLNRPKEAREAFETARRLTPEWALPPLQIAQQMINAGDLRGALPHLEQAARLHPRAVGIGWSLARLYRSLGRSADFVRTAQAVITVDRNYAPIYSELGLYYEAAGDPARAAQNFDTYLLLAPNFADSADIRQRSQKNRAASTRPRAPTLRRPGDK